MLGAAQSQQFSKLAVSHRCRRAVCPGVILFSKRYMMERLHVGYSECWTE